MSLPPELRNCIYGLVLSNLGQINTAYDGEYKRTGILRTSKQIRSEALSVYYTTNSFRVSLNRKDFPAFLTWLRNVAKTCGRQPFGGMKVVSYGRSEWLLDAMPHMLEVMRETGLEIATEYEISYQSTFRVYAGPFGYGDAIQRILQDALELGREARHNAWTKEELENEYRNFLEGSSSGESENESGQEV